MAYLYSTFVTKLLRKKQDVFAFLSQKYVRQGSDQTHARKIGVCHF